MTAEQMFNELGYKLISINEKYIKYENFELEAIIEFELKNKRYVYYSPLDVWNSIIDSAYYIDIPLNNAIQQQLKELKWI